MCHRGLLPIERGRLTRSHFLKRTKTTKPVPRVVWGGRGPMGQEVENFMHSQSVSRTSGR